jgi:diguanylate cyclase (GGDEF)-like protein
VLQVLAGEAGHYNRKMDLFARIGGEEFVAVLPETDLDEAFWIADKLRTTIEHQEYIHTWRTGQAIPFTVSIGVATRAPGETEVGAVLKRADEALYKAKEGGRNRVERA